MNNKKVLVSLCCLLIIFSLTSCKSDENTDVLQESTTLDYLTNAPVAETVYNTEAPVIDTTENTIQNTTQSAVSEITTNTKETETTETYDEYSKWSKAKIVEEYKNAAIKSGTTAKSQQKIIMKDLKINGGENEKMMSFIKSIITKFLESNSTEINGITGSYENLVADDVSSAKASKVSNGVAIEMLMNEQTSGTKEDVNSGSVGHAISTIGDISDIVKDLNDRGLSIELSENEEDTKIYYTNPIVNVVIDENGEIVSGTWNCTVTISMNNLKAFGKDVDNVTIVMDNTITV